MGPESSSAPREPTRELLLAQALDACIEAERRAPGSAAEIIARQPAWARDELRRLVDLAGALDSAAAKTVISEDFRVAARERLMQRIAGRPGVASDSGAGAWLTPVPSANGNVYRVVRRPGRWMWRGFGGGLLAAALVAAATLSASASSLPGDALYGLKQAQEELGVRMAPDDEARGEPDQRSSEDPQDQSPDDLEGELGQEGNGGLEHVDVHAWSSSAGVGFAARGPCLTGSADATDHVARRIEP